MKTFVELESTRYWHAKILKEIKEYRRQKGREAAASMTMVAMFFALASVGFYVISQGWLDDLDVAGGFDFAREVVSTAWVNFTEFLRTLR